jgi:hypothetical protein
VQHGQVAARHLSGSTAKIVLSSLSNVLNLEEATLISGFSYECARVSQYSPKS